jgi:hypothetical protein
MRTFPGLFAALLMLVCVGCSSGEDDTDETPDAGQSAGTDEPKLAATCTSSPDTCPAGMSCFLELGCIVSSCPSAGPGAAHGCPKNGFCYTADSSTQGYCARVCKTDSDCTAVNPNLLCRERSSTEAFNMKVCILP